METMVDFLMDPASPGCGTVVGIVNQGRGNFSLDKGCDCDLHDFVSCRSSKIS